MIMVGCDENRFGAKFLDGSPELFDDDVLRGLAHFPRQRPVLIPVTDALRRRKQSRGGRDKFAGSALKERTGRKILNTKLQDRSNMQTCPISAISKMNSDERSPWQLVSNEGISQTIHFIVPDEVFLNCNVLFLHWKGCRGSRKRKHWVLFRGIPVLPFFGDSY